MAAKKNQKFLRELFALYDLDPKSAFKIQGEQIDGAFAFEGSDYLLEAKWENAPLPASSVYEFKGKITGKLDNTLGFFVSMSGFSEDALVAIDKADKKVCILADGFDLISVLEGRIHLDDLIRRKKRHAVQTGKAFISAKEFV